jgi:hypothetical protein
MVFINLSYDQQDLLKYLSHHNIDSASVSLIDITGICQGNFHQHIIARRVDADHLTEKRALNDYIATIGELSRIPIERGRSIRDLKVNGLPVFWTTVLSEKHDSYHWGQAVFFLKHFLIDNARLISGHSIVNVLLPHGNAHLAELINTFFPKDITVKIISASNAEAFSFLALTKRLCSYLINIWKTRTFLRSLKNDSPEKDLLFVGSMVNNTTRQAYEFAEKLRPTAIIPFPYNEIHVYDVWKNATASFVKSYPSILQLVKIYYQVLISFLYVQYYFRTENRKLFIFDGILRSELKQSLQDIHLFVIHCWFRNYFKHLSGRVKVFYEDEFYRSGRVISSAAILSGNRNVTTYGMQHGVITESHTVYRFSDDELMELRPNDGLPFPDYFIVWGEIFKKMVVTGNSFDPERILVNGNLLYFRRQHVPVEIKTLPGKKFLWCTTLFQYATMEYMLMKEYLLNAGDISLTIRLHPVPHIKRDDLEKIIDPAILAFTHFNNEQNFIQQISEHDVIISSAQSTVYLDGLFAAKLVIRIDAGACMPGFSDLNTPFLKDVKNPAEFKEAMLFFPPSAESLHDISQFFYRGDKRWIDTFLNSDVC